jgi:hypothetical protein
LRNYDAQIGRFVQADPYEQFANPYTGMGNDPVNNVDEDGGFVGWVGALTGAVAGGASSYAIAKNNGAHGWGLAAYTVGGAVLGAGLGYATDMTFFNSASQTSSFFGNFRNFYAGVLGIGGVNVKEAGEKIIGRAEGCISSVKVAIDAPNLWGWVGNISLPSLNINLFSWVDDIALSAWRVIDIQKLVTEGAASQNPDYTPMDRTVKTNSSGERYVPDDVRVNDKKTVTVPTGDKTKTKLEIEGPGDNPGIFERSFSTEKKGSSYKVTIDHRAQSGAGYRYNPNGSVASGGKSYKPTESKVKVTTYRREKIAIKRLKVLGIKTPFTRKP